MNDLLERYLAAVCCYFRGSKKKRVYNDLKKTIQSITSKHNEIENVLIDLGHPLSIAYDYGYKPFLIHHFNHKIISKVEKSFLICLFFYFILSNIFSLSLFHIFTIPFISQSSFLLSIYNQSFFFLIILFIIHLLYLYFQDKKYPRIQDQEIIWNKEKLEQLPPLSYYPNHIFDYYFIFIFSIFFLFYIIIFSTSLINKVQNTSYTMIYLMRDFFNPFFSIIFFLYFFDLSKKTYSKKYLLYRSLFYLVIFLSLSFFLLITSFLKDYLLPWEMNYYYLFINLLILIIIVFIYFIVFINLIKTIKYYQKTYHTKQ